jgi:hypothetical protein
VAINTNRSISLETCCEQVSRGYDGNIRDSSIFLSLIRLAAREFQRVAKRSTAVSVVAAMGAESPASGQTRKSGFVVTDDEGVSGIFR